MTELKALRQKYNDTVFNFESAKTDLKRLTQELEQERSNKHQSEPACHNHCVSSNCKNLERLVDLLNTKVKEAEHNIKTTHQSNVEIATNCKSVEEQANTSQKLLENLEKQLFEIKQKNNKLNIKHQVCEGMVQLLLAKQEETKKSLNSSQKNIEEIESKCDELEQFKVSLQQEINEMKTTEEVRSIIIIIVQNR